MRRSVLAVLALSVVGGCAETGEFIDPDTHGSLFDANIFTETSADLGDAGQKAAFGAPCSDSKQCQSLLCLKGCTGYACSKKCSKGTSSCGAGFGCVGVNGVIEPGVVDFVCVQHCEAGAPDAAVPDAAVPDAAAPDLPPPDLPAPDLLAPDVPCPLAVRPCYSGPAATKGVGLCKAGTQNCAAGTWGPCSGAVLPGKESCNNKDDDCNGKTDDGLSASCYTGKASTLGVGLCKAGKKTCTAGKWGACAGQVLPVSKEACDNKDNDCDGFTDEGLLAACYSGKASTLGVGPCKAGKKTCTAGSYGSCAGQVTPVAELCDNVDNDCDGFTDDGLKLSCYSGKAGTKGVGACKAGHQTCSAGKWGGCAGQVTPKAEACDNKDNDCDGSTDEGLKVKCPYTGKVGTENVGLCRAGNKTCAAGKWSGCVGQITPVAESCDNKDNDCDGNTDEGLTVKCAYTGKAGTENVGLCRAGKKTCAAGKWGACVGQVVPATEVCDGKDNDCDGKADELMSFAASKWCGKGTKSQPGSSYAMDLRASFNGGKGPTFTFGGIMTYSGSFVGKNYVSAGTLKCRHAEWQDGVLISGGPFINGTYKADFSADGKTLSGQWYWYGMAMATFKLTRYTCP